MEKEFVIMLIRQPQKWGCFFVSCYTIIVVVYYYYRRLDMAEQEQEVVQATEQVQDDVKATSVNTDDLSKKEIAGLNRRISELEKANQSKEAELLKAQREKMSEKELAEAEKADLEKERNAIKTERRNLTVSKALVNAGLDPEKFSRRITGETKEEIEKDVAEFKEYLDTLSRDIADKKVKETLKVDPPKSGSSVKKMTEEEISRLPDRKQRQEARRANGYIK